MFRAFEAFTVTRDDHSNTVYSQLSVFIPVGWGCTQLFGDIDIAPSVQNTRQTPQLGIYLDICRW